MKTKVTQRLATVLKDGVDVHRCAAARALGVIGGPLATKVLQEALLDEDPDVRVDAATALVKINNPAIAEKLMENLIGDPDADVKLAAIGGLIAMGHKPIVPLLRALTVDRAEDQIAWDEEAFYQDGWDSWLDIQIAAIKGLGTFAHEAAVGDILKALLDEEGQDVTEPAFNALAKMGAAGAQALSTIYSSGEPRLCRRIARAVGASDNPDLEQLGQELLSDPLPEVRALAVKNFAPGDARLEPLFDDEDPKVRAGAVRHIGSKNPTKLRDLIADPEPKVRTEVFKIIQEHPELFDEKTDAEAIKKALKGDPEAARNAALALFALKGPKVAKGFAHVLSKDDVPQEFRIGVLETLEKAGDIAVPMLLDVAGDADRQLRLASLTVLANIAAKDSNWPNDAGQGLLTALNGELVLPPEEPDEPIIEEPVAEQTPDQAELDDIAAEIAETAPLVAEDATPGSTLHSIMKNSPEISDKEPEEIVLGPDEERLLAMTNTRKFSKKKITWKTEVAPYLDVRRFSARLLGQIVRPDVTAALSKALEQDIDDETLDAVLFSLASHAQAGATMPADLDEKLRTYLESENSETRVLAVRVLAGLQVDDVLDRLRDLLSHEDALVRVEAVQGLQSRNIAGDTVAAALHDSYLGVGIAAARSLAEVSGASSVNQLVEFATRNDGIYRRDIGQLFAKFAPEAGASGFLELLNDDDRKIQWLVAIDALAELFEHEAPDETRLVA